MLALIKHWFKSRASQPYVRPWGMAVPIAVLVICLPILRPLLHPDTRSDNERERFATIESLVEHGSFSFDGGSFNLPEKERRINNLQPPVLACLMAGPYWVMDHFGLTFRRNTALAEYLLILLGSTLPVAVSGTVIYRLGRIFELSRPRRTILSIATIFGSGLIAYATTLNGHAPAAMLLLCAMASLYSAAGARTADHVRGYMMLGGLLAGFAAVIDMGAIFFLFLLPLTALTFKGGAWQRIVMLFSYILAAAVPLLLHCWLTQKITGDIRPGFLHQNYGITPIDDEDRHAVLRVVSRNLHDGGLGAHGVFSHFPIVAVGVVGLWIVVRRHWPGPIKTLAGVTGISALLVVGAYTALNPDWNQPMFGVRWYVFFLPLITFWGGAWLRRPHRPGVWISAAFVLGFSILVNLIGAAAPFPQGRPGEYTLKSSMIWMKNSRTPAVLNTENR